MSELAATKTFPPPSIKFVMAATSTDPPNSYQEKRRNNLYKCKVTSYKSNF